MFWQERKRTIFILLFLMLFSINIFGVKSNRNKGGVIDFTKIDLNKADVLNLDGEWEFYWKRFIETEKEDYIDYNYSYEKVPDPWVKYKKEEKRLSGYGYASYKVHIKLDKIYKRLGMEVERLGGVYKLWINGKLYLSDGEIAKDYSSEKMSYKTKTVYFTVDDDELDIVFEISNHHYSKGGIWRSIKFGTEKNIERYVNRSIAYDILILGSLILMSMLCIILFLIYPGEKRFIYFALFSFDVSIRYIATGKAFAIFFGDNFPEILKLRIEYISFYIGVPIFMLFIKDVFQKEYSKKIVKLSLIMGGTYMFTTLILPFRIIDKLNYIYQIYAMLILVYMLKAMGDAFRRKREYANILIYSFFIMSLCIFVDILTAMGLSKFPPLGYFGVYIFTIFQAYANFKYLSKLQRESIGEKIREEKVIRKSPSIKDAKGISELERKDVNSIISYTKGLNNLINDIMNFSKTENDDIHILNRSIQLKFLVEIISFLLQVEAKINGVKIVNEISSDIKIYADEDRVKQIFYNIVGNAVKYSKSKEVVISAVEKKDEVEVAIKDNGIGIEKDKAREIKELFESEAETAERDFGFGLSISKSLLDIFHSKIWFETEEGEGSRFYFTLPKCKEKVELKSKSIVYISEEPQRTVYKNNTDEKYKILAVDDDQVNLNVLLGFLTLRNYEVVITTSGKEALELLDDSFSLVILDVMMPEISGFDVCKKIREKYSLSEMPVLMLTAKNQYSDIELGFESGANDYSVKPIEKRELLKRVEALLKLKKTTEERINRILEEQDKNFVNVYSEKNREFLNKLSKNFDYDSIIDLLFDELKENKDYTEILFFVINGKDEIELRSKSGIEIDLSSGDMEIVGELLEAERDFMENREFSFSNSEKENYSVAFRTGVKNKVIIYIESEKKIVKGLVENLNYLISQTAIAMENVYLFLKKEEVMRKIMVIEQLSSIIYREKDIDKVVEYLLNVLVFALREYISRVHYFDYYNDSASFLISKTVENKFDKEKEMESEQIIEKIEENVAKSGKPKEYIRIKESELKNFQQEVNFVNDKKIITKFKSESLIFGYVEHSDVKYGAIFAELLEKEMDLEIKGILDLFMKNLALFINRIIIEQREYQSEEEKSFRCKKCNTKLSEYKGEIDFLEIKCPKCNTMNRIEMKNISKKHEK